VTTLLFIAHPLHTEAVTYISGRKDLLGGLFSVAALLSFVMTVRSGSRTPGLLLVLFFLLAVASKEIYAVIPLLMVVTAYIQGTSMRRYAPLAGVLLAGAGVFILYVLFFRNQQLFNYLHTVPVYGNGQGVNVATAIKICAYNLSLAFHPFSLSADYTYNAVKRINAASLQFAVSLLVLAGCAAAAWYYRYQWKELSMGFLWMLICLLPVSQVVPYPEIISERSLVLLTVGACLIMASILVRLPRVPGILVLGTILVAFSVTTIDRNQDWHDNLSLWQATVLAQPDCARAHYNLGIAFLERNRCTEAKKAFIRSLEINPPHLVTVPDYSVDALLNLGTAYAAMKQFDRARRLFHRVLTYRPEDPLTMRNLRILDRMEQDVKRE
jgi:tetratricopeptide (TPR) repeat protein